MKWVPHPCDFFLAQGWETTNLDPPVTPASAFGTWEAESGQLAQNYPLPAHTGNRIAGSPAPLTGKRAPPAASTHTKDAKTASRATLFARNSSSIKALGKIQGTPPPCVSRFFALKRQGVPLPPLIYFCFPQKFCSAFRRRTPTNPVRLQAPRTPERALRP